MTKGYQRAKARAALIDAVRAGRHDRVRELLADDPTLVVPTIDDEGDTPLQEAVRLLNPKMIALLTGAGAPADVLDEYGHGLFHLAVRSASVDISGKLAAFDQVLGVLVRSGANINQMADDRRTALTGAVVAGADAALLTSLVRHGSSVLAGGPLENNAWSIALAQCRPAVIAALLDALPDDGAAQALVRTSLLDLAWELEKRASRFGPSSIADVREAARETAAMLMQRGADVNALDDRRATPLMFAASIPDPFLCELLLAHGARPNDGDGKGNTPLMVAAVAVLPDNVRVLLAAGADPFRKAGDMSVLQVMASKCVAESPEPVLQLVRLFAELGVPPDGEHDGRRPLLIAVTGLDRTMVDALLEAGADVNARDPDGMTALGVAALAWNAPLMARLMAAGADPTARVTAGATLVHLIVAAGFTTETHREEFDAALHLALASGVDVNARDDEGQTALVCAARISEDERVSALLAAGGDPMISALDGGNCLSVATGMLELDPQSRAAARIMEQVNAWRARRALAEGAGVR